MVNTVEKKLAKMVRCKNCGELLGRIWFTALCTEEWSWNGEGYNECTARHSLLTDPQKKVVCPHCEMVIGTGYALGFGKGETRVL